MSFRRTIASFAVVPAVVTLGCSAGDMMEGEVAASTRQALRAPGFEMPQNGLEPRAVARNILLLEKLREHRLDTHELDVILSRDPRIAELFKDAGAVDANELMDVIVSCALDPDEKVTAKVRAGTFTWQGQLGLCGKESPLGSWGGDVPTQGCLEVVSSCVLARMNALERQVPISIRGQDASLFVLRDKVRVERELRDRKPIASFEACTTDVTKGKKERDCGWQAAYVGRCEPKTSVTLERELLFEEQPMVRVCRGIYGCDHDQPDVASSPELPYYAGFVADFAKDEKISFPCPPGDLFSVMLASPSSKEPLPPELDVHPSPGTPAHYPAKEEDVFTYREGSFFGDVFKGTKSRYACYSDIWSLGKAHLADRLCAGPAGEDCLPHEPSPCRAAPDGDERAAPATTHLCFGESEAPSSAYLDCEGEQRVRPPWHHGVTVFLSDPCALSSDTKSCLLAQKCTHSECTTGAPLDGGCSPVVTSVCAADAYCCNVAWDAQCVAEVKTVAKSAQCVEGTCNHPLSTSGDELTPGCDVPALSSPGCVARICKMDPYCCNSAWDGICVDEFQSECALTECSHDECATGAALFSDCSSIARSVCRADPFCCTTAWDSLCVREVRTLAGGTCG
ncbi:hypothetical protein [Sorangium sp. So ce124]|uniref:hypothetical protein n=1 Tax=Sorangium sp. So ce124 TaxID=3133280 RepID=UPI003F60082B